MFENYDYDYLMESMLSNVSDNLDKREGSVIWDALAPIAVELSKFYANLDIALNEVFADSASYYYLIKRAAERGLVPKEGTNAVLKMIVTPFSTVIEKGDRFNLDDLNYEVIDAIDKENGVYQVMCETPGIIGNQQTGTLLPIEYIDGLEKAELIEVIIPGEDEEDVEDFRARYFSSFTDKAFGGNKADYIRTVENIDGVGSCKVIRIWNGDFSPSDFIPNPEVEQWINSLTSADLDAEILEWIKLIYKAAKQHVLTVGGKVKIIINNSNYDVPSPELVRSVKVYLDPEETTGEGDGVVPIGHVVEVSGVAVKPVNINFSIIYKSGCNFNMIKDKIFAAIDGYFDLLKEGWAEKNQISITSSALNALITNLNLREIENIPGVQLSLDGISYEQSVSLGIDEIPIRGVVNG